jgi:hypothetical protein
MVRILEFLNQRTTVDERVAKSGPELPETIRAEAGQNSVGCSIHSFRTRVTEVLQTELGLKSDNLSGISCDDPIRRVQSASVSRRKLPRKMNYHKKQFCDDPCMGRQNESG